MDMRERRLERPAGERSTSEEYLVVWNHEGQYSIWLADREPPAGWQAVGVRGSKDDCLAYIEETWTDMRPLSLQRRMQEEQEDKL